MGIKNTAEQETGSLTIDVDLGPRSYMIEVVSGGKVMSFLGPFIKGCLEKTWAGKGCQKALIVADENVMQPWAKAVDTELQGLGIETLVAEVAAGEKSKSIEALVRLYDRLIDLKADRHTLVVAVGGGVVGDLAGYAAASFNRGLPLVMIPTTLLSQVDSSVGGKTGINHPRGKNLIGAFHQPIGVWIDVHTLSTLPEREYRSGLAEVLKYGVIQDPEFFEYLEKNAEAALARDEGVLKHLVARSCRLKADVVEKDELEHTGLRAILNFGHTVAHAIENVAGYGEYLHGEAVAAGMIAETKLAEKIGWVSGDLPERIARLIMRLQLPTTIKPYPLEALVSAMRHDKKNKSGRIRFVLPKALGQVELTDKPTDDDIAAVLREMMA